jgi:hypothetical protein
MRNEIAPGISVIATRDKFVAQESSDKGFVSTPERFNYELQSVQRIPSVVPLSSTLSTAI